LGCDLDEVVFVVGVDSEAAPLPLFRLFDQAGLYRIAMHVTKFFDFFGFREDVEVVVTGFPDELFGLGAGETLLDDWIAVDSFAWSGSVMSRWMWFDMKT
jgi:hypothetical protein